MGLKVLIDDLSGLVGKIFLEEDKRKLDSVFFLPGSGLARGLRGSNLFDLRTERQLVLLFHCLW